MVGVFLFLLFAAAGGVGLGWARGKDLGLSFGVAAAGFVAAVAIFLSDLPPDDPLVAAGVIRAFVQPAELLDRIAELVGYPLLLLVLAVGFGIGLLVGNANKKPAA